MGVLYLCRLLDLKHIDVRVRRKHHLSDHLTARCAMQAVKIHVDGAMRRVDDRDAIAKVAAQHFAFTQIRSSERFRSLSLFGEDRSGFHNGLTRLR